MPDEFESRKKNSVFFFMERHYYTLKNAKKDHSFEIASLYKDISKGNKIKVYFD